jgi:large subunit ribosomal protein L31
VLNKKNIYLCGPIYKTGSIMKNDIHPENYRLVVFKDMTNEYSFLGKSTASSGETVAWEDGNEYPLVKLEITSKSHPFFTGKMQFVDTAGRIDKFKNKYAKWDKKPAKQAEGTTDTEETEGQGE